MGLILDSSVLIAAQRNGETVTQLLKRVLAVMGNQETALSAVALVEFVHGIYRANTPQVRTRREAFIQELLADVPVYPFTQPIALLAGESTPSNRARASRFRSRTCRLELRPCIWSTRW